MIKGPDGGYIPSRSAEELLACICKPARVQIQTMLNMPKLLDSTNVGIDDQIEMAEHIAEHYENHDAFVVLHGTDTLAETCAAFLRIFEKTLQKTIVVVGAQMARGEVNSDAELQIGTALRVARAFHRKKYVGVFTACMGNVLDGARTMKRNESDFAAFHTPGRDPVAKCWPKMLYQEHLLRTENRAIAAEGLQLHKAFDRKVAIFDVHANIPPSTLLSNVFHIPPGPPQCSMMQSIIHEPIHPYRIHGAILRAKGSGNIPDKPYDKNASPDSWDSLSWMEAVNLASNYASVRVVGISPFDDGRINTRYGLGKQAQKAGMMSGGSLTAPMAFISLAKAIAVYGAQRGRADIVQQFLLMNSLGEMLPGVQDDDEDE